MAIGQLTWGVQGAQKINRSLSNVREAINFLVPDSVKFNGELTQKGKDIYEASCKFLDLPKDAPIDLFHDALRAKQGSVEVLKKYAPKFPKIAEQYNKFVASVPETLKEIIQRYNEHKGEFLGILRK